MANKNMEIMLRLRAKIDKAIPKDMEELTQKAKKLKEAYSRGTPKGFAANLSTELSKAKNNFKLAQHNLSKASVIKPQYENIRKEYSVNLLELRKVRAEMKRLEKAKATGIKLSSEEEKKLKKLISQNQKLSQATAKQRITFERYRIEAKKLSGTLDDYQKELAETEKKVKSLTAQQNLLNKVSNFKNGLKNAAGKVVGKIATGVKYGAVAAGTAAGYTSIASAKSYLEFEQNMKKVQAISGATAKEYQTLEKEAIRLGATTKFTAGESAAAMEKMALAGFKTNQIIAAMSGVLDLAAASGEDVAMVSDIITDNLLPFKMAAEDTKRFADVLAWGMSKTNVTVEMLGESFKYASGSAGNLGVNLEEMVGTLGLMGDQAIKSGMAGRGMDSIFSELIKKKDLLAHEKIKINIDNGKGEFVGLVKTVEQFENYLKDKTDIERTAFLQNVFGDQGSRAFSKLLMAEKEINGITYKGAEAVAKTVEAARKDSVGMSEKMRDIMLEGASGTWTLFTSAVDGFRVTLGKLLLNDKVLAYIRKVTNYISELTNVMSGVFNNSYYNIFWQKVFISTRNFIAKFKTALQPGIDVIKRLFPANEMSKDINKFISILGKSIIFLASVFSKIMQIAEPFIKIIKFIGIDTILVFTGIFMAVSKTISIFAKLKAVFLFIKEIGGIAALVKTVMAAFGGPVVLGIAAVAAGLYFVYKNFDTLKKVFKGAFDVFFGVINAAITGIKELFSKISEYKGIFNILIPGKIILDGLKSFWNSWDSGLSVLENIKNGFKAFFSGLKGSISSAIEDFGKLIKKVNEFETVKKFKKFFGFGGNDKADGSHKTGLSYVPFDNYIARLHKGERVLTKEENEKYNVLKFFIEHFQKVKIPEIPNWIIKIKEKNINKENIDGSHKTGLSYVPFDNYIARLHKGERVLTKEENERYNSFKATNNFIKNSSGIQNSQKITNKIIEFKNKINNGTVNNFQNIFSLNKDTQGSLLQRFNKIKEENKSTNLSQNKKSYFNFSPKIEIKVTGASIDSEDISMALEKKIKELEEKFIRLIESREEIGNDYVRTSF